MIADLLKSVFVGPLWFRFFSLILLFLVVLWLYFGVRIADKKAPVELSAFSIDACFRFDDPLGVNINPILHNPRSGFSAILEIFTNGSKGDSDETRLHIASRWSRDQFIDSLQRPFAYIDTSENKVVVRFLKPFIEYSRGELLYDKEYVIALTAFPNFATPLVPEYLHFRHDDGSVTRVTGFTNSSSGWYAAPLIFKEK